MYSTMCAHDPDWSHPTLVCSLGLFQAGLGLFYTSSRSLQAGPMFGTSPRMFVSSSSSSEFNQVPFVHIVRLKFLFRYLIGIYFFHHKQKIQWKHSAPLSLVGCREKSFVDLIFNIYGSCPSSKSPVGAGRLLHISAHPPLTLPWTPYLPTFLPS